MTRYLFNVRNIWFFAFCYTAALSLVFQTAVLPLLPSLHAGQGLLKNDAYFYHQAAAILAGDIHLHGWSVWSLWSSVTNTTGNVGILSAIYAFFSPNPALVIPVNAFFNATSASLLFLIGKELWGERAGKLAGLFVAGLFVFFPTALSWYSQPLKDTYVITGIFMIAYSLILALRKTGGLWGMFLPFIWMMMGTLLVTLVKPYYLKLLIVSALVVAIALAIQLFLTRYPQRLRILSFYVFAGVFAGLVAMMVRPYMPASDNGEVYAASRIGEKIKIGGESGATKSWEWKPSAWLPQSMEKNLELAARTRAGMISFNQAVGAGSLIDAENVPDSTVELFEYLPRAIQIGLFAPFPDTWMQKPSAIRLLAVTETICWYFLVPGILLAYYRRRSPGLMVTTLFAVFYIAVLSYVTPNIGTLYRYRYAFEFLLMIIAAGGWVEWYLDRCSKGGGNEDRQLNESSAGVLESERSDNRGGIEGGSRWKLLSAALFVSMLTLVGYLGFFLRDLFMVRVFGAGNEMDIFYLGTMIPMFFVSVFSMPIGSALMPVYTEISSGDRVASARIMSGVAIIQILFMALAALVLHLAASVLFSAIGFHMPFTRVAEISNVMDIYLIIMLIGGVIIIGNTVLNAEGALIFPALAQLAVPIVVILLIVIWGASSGIYAAVYGMLLGQFVNLMLVLWALHSRGRLLPMLRPEFQLARRKFPMRQYGILVVAALSASLFSPLANTIAGQIPSAGNVTIIGMGTKVVMLFTGVIGIGLTTVLLPYFSNLAAKSYHLKAQADLSFFLLLATLITVPLALVLRLLAATLTYQLVAHSAMTEKDVNELIRTIQYGVAQLPFFTCSLIAIKYITAYQRAGIILISSLVGLILTILLSQLFIQLMGVSGILLAMTIALMVSTVLLVAYVNHLRQLPIKDSLYIFVNWIFFGLIFTAIYYHHIVLLVVLGLAYLLLSFGNWKVLITEWGSEEINNLANSRVG